MTYVYLMENAAPLDGPLVKAHVEHLRTLERQGRLVLCGPFSDYPGGMVVFTAENPEKARATAEADPFISSGRKTFTLRTLEPANGENNYLLNDE